MPGILSFMGPSNFVPPWAPRTVPSTWQLVTSEAVELDISGGALSAGALYIKNEKEQPATTHRIYFAGAGPATGIGPLPIGFGASYSTVDNWSIGTAQSINPLLNTIGLAPDKNDLQLGDFSGPGAMATVTIAHRGFLWFDRHSRQLQPLSNGASLTVITFGTPPVACMWMMGTVHSIFGIGLTALTCFFSVNDDRSTAPFPPGL